MQIGVASFVRNKMNRVYMAWQCRDMYLTGLLTALQKCVLCIGIRSMPSFRCTSEKYWPVCGQVASVPEVVHHNFAALELHVERVREGGLLKHFH